jgi:predicted dehydrogenase
MLDVGLIGLGPEWERRYSPALVKLRHRLRVRSVYAPVITHAEQVSAELDCDVSPGMVALMDREDVRALLVLDAAWYAGIPARFACRAGKPAFLAGRLMHRLPMAEELMQRAAETGVTLMPDFSHRYTPGTSRLRELIASRLGRPLEIVVDAAPPIPAASGDESPPATERELLASAIDWCTNLVGTPPAVLRAVPIEEAKPGCFSEISVAFRRPAAGGDAARAIIRLIDQEAATVVPSHCEGAPIALAAHVTCAKGIAWLEGPRQVTWQHDGERLVESLATDRSDVEVMLDHFSRRVVGGLIPVPTLEDLCRAYQLVDTVLDGG